MPKTITLVILYIEFSIISTPKIENSKINFWRCFLIERIIALMAARGIKGIKLATELGLAKNAVSEWKSGKAKPGTEAIIKIADYFGVTTDYLLTGKTNNSRPTIINLVENQKEDTNMTKNTKEGLSMNEKAREALHSLNDMFCSILERLIEHGNRVESKANVEALLKRLGIDKYILLAWANYRYLETPPSVFVLDELANALQNGFGVEEFGSSTDKYIKHIADFEYYSLKEEAESQELKQRNIKIASLEKENARLQNEPRKAKQGAIEATEIASLEKENERLKQENAKLQNELQKTKPSVYETDIDDEKDAKMQD